MNEAAEQYLLCDCASAPDAYPVIAKLEPLDAGCLFEGELSETVRRASPFIVRLPQGDPQAEAWLRSLPRQALTLVRSRRRLDQVRRRFRRNMQVRLPDGTGPALFRIWDPRVAAVFFPTLSPEALTAWRSDIDAIFVPNADGWLEVGVAPA
jgi:hypothetical protein